jgi:parallel beta-helix repeat protein
MNFGIYLDNSRYNSIDNNFINENNMGMYALYSSSFNIFKDNIVNYSSMGLVLGESSSNNLINNFTITRPAGNYGIYFDVGVTNNILQNSLIDANYVYGFVAIDGYSETNNTLIQNNRINNIGSGGEAILVSYSGNVVNNVLQGFGIYLNELRNSFVYNNTIKNVSQGDYYYVGYGMRIDRSYYNTIRDNQITNSNRSVYIESSANNSIYNNFFNSTSLVYFSSEQTNFWNTTLTSGTNIVGGSKIGGNYWATPSGNGFSQYCVDLDTDRICDQGTTLGSLNRDYLPLK